MRASPIRRTPSTARFYLNFHPHVHTQITEGVVTDDGTLLPLLAPDLDAVTELFRRLVLAALRRMVRDERETSSVTAYFAYFVARALQIAGDRDGALAFARTTYGPIAAQLGTIWEKHDDTESRAHGWTVAIAQLLAERAEGPPIAGADRR